MERVTGIGGVFFRASDPDSLSMWYERHLGVERPAVDVHAKTYPNGRFADLTDPEGNPVQLWEPAGADAVPPPSA